MAKNKNLSKKVQVDRAQATIVGVIAAAVFISVFSLVSVRALWKQRTYQANVISKKQKARDVLKENTDTVSGLVGSYKTFVESGTNILGGNPAGAGDKDGDNARLVLDALPSKYDFPALTASLEKILTERNFKIDGISGVDDELTQAKAAESGTPQPVEIPFQVSVSGSYTSIQELIGVFEKSIRPFSVKSYSLSGGANDMKMSADLITYFQPEKTLNIKKETVK